VTLVFKKTPIFSKSICENLKNCDHNIDPGIDFTKLLAGRKLFGLLFTL
jgi:hypothetical protein